MTINVPSATPRDAGPTTKQSLAFNVFADAKATINQSRHPIAGTKYDILARKSTVAAPTAATTYRGPLLASARQVSDARYSTSWTLPILACRLTAT